MPGSRESGLSLRSTMTGLCTTEELEEEVAMLEDEDVVELLVEETDELLLVDVGGTMVEVAVGEMEVVTDEVDTTVLTTVVVCDERTAAAPPTTMITMITTTARTTVRDIP